MAIPFNEARPALGKILITGANGMLGRAFRRVLAGDHVAQAVFGLGHLALDVTDRQAVGRWASERIEAIVHCAGLVDADACERDPELARRVHVDGTLHVAELARASGARVVFPQSFLVFGTSPTPYDESAVPLPLSEYGRVKLEAEQRLLEVCPQALVVRMGGFFGGWWTDKNFVGKLCAGLLRHVGKTVAVGTRVWQPTWTEDLARNTLFLLGRGEQGVWHMAAHGQATFHDVARVIWSELGLDDRIELTRADAAESSRLDVARRPEKAILDNKRLRDAGVDRMRPWDVALREYLRHPFFERIADEVHSART